MAALVLLLCAQDRVDLKDHGSHYFLHRPAGYAEGKSWAVVLELHGAGDRAVEPARQALGAWKDLADRRGYVVVAPQARGRAWETTDAAFVRACLDDAKTRLRADPERVLVSGFAEGADLALELAGAQPDLFAGCAALLNTAFRDVKEGPPWYVVVGADDPGKKHGKAVAGMLSLEKREYVFREVPGLGHQRPSREEHAKVLDWFEVKAKARADLEVVDRFIRKGRYLDASLVAIGLMDREDQQLQVKWYLNAMEATGLVALGKVELAFANRKYLDAVLRCREAAVQFSWLPVGERARKRLGELESDPRVKSALQSRD